MQKNQILLKQPLNTQFKQQSIPGKMIIYSPPCAVSLMVAVSIIFLALGAAILIESDSVVEIVQRYDDKQACAYNKTNPKQLWDGCKYIYPFEIPRTMKAPVFLYYQLTNYYQNHRKYVKSMSTMQLAGQDPATVELMSDCKPRLTNKDKSLTYSPAGLMPWSMFNDSFALYGADGTLFCDGELFTKDKDSTPLQNMTCTKKGIAWDSDKDKYAPPFNGTNILTYTGRTDKGNKSYIVNGWYEFEDYHPLPNPQDEDFMVWMRNEPISSFRKLYRVIQTDLTAGSYVMHVKQRYDVLAFGGTKSFVLLKPGWIGAPNRPLAGFYLAVGSLSFVFSVTFILKLLIPSLNPSKR